MKKGFTLVELLATILILGVLTTIATVSINSILKNAREKAYNLQIENIKDGAKSWAAKNMFDLKDDGSVTLTLYFLKQKGLVEQDIKNPDTDELFEDDLLITITNNNGYVYDVIENENEIIFNENILVVINGTLVENIVSKEGTYIDKGIIAKDKNENTLNYTTTIIKDNNTIENINLNEKEKYIITYEINYLGNTSIIQRKINIT